MDDFGGTCPTEVVVVVFLADAQVGVEVNIYFLFLCFLGRDNNDTIGSPCSIDGSSGSVFQNRDVFYVVWIDGFDRAFYRKSVNNDQWVGLGLERTNATDGKRGFAISVDAVFVRNQARYFALQVANDVARVSLVHVLGSDGLVRTCGILALDVLVTGHQDIVHHDFIGLHGDGHVFPLDAACFKHLVFHTDI